MARDLDGARRQVGNWLTANNIVLNELKEQIWAPDAATRRAWEGLPGHFRGAVGPQAKDLGICLRRLHFRNTVLPGRISKLTGLCQRIGVSPSVGPGKYSKATVWFSGQGCTGLKSIPLRPSSSESYVSNLRGLFGRIEGRAAGWPRCLA